MTGSQDFAGRVVIVTGDASGQDRVAVDLFAARGATVVGSAITRPAPLTGGFAAALADPAPPRATG